MDPHPQHEPGDADDAQRRVEEQPLSPPSSARIREADLEPHEGLRYIARLFKALAILLAFLLVAEVVIGFRQEGSAALMTIMVEGTRIVVFAGFLWAAGDLAMMFVASNHDLRAIRILLGRLNDRMERFMSEADGRQQPPSPPPAL